MTRLETTDDLEALMEALPVEIVERVRAFANRADLLEIVMDLGRRPEARFTHGEELLDCDGRGCVATKLPDDAHDFRQRRTIDTDRRRGLALQ